uniref:Nop domain-containing protein n=1 Tax=Strongyloides papillosus TaxID=174720 RepID=A0A0N5CC23_STREA
MSANSVDQDVFRREDHDNGEIPDGDDLLADPVKVHVRYLREREFTLEGILGLTELGEKVGTVLKRTLWASEDHIYVLRMFSDMNGIHDVRQMFVAKQAEEMKIAGVTNKGSLSNSAQMEIDKAVKATLPKNIDYGVLRSTEEVKKMLQSMANVRAKAASCVVNGSGQISFPIGISVPKLKQFKMEFVSGVFAGSFPESIRVLWLCGFVPGGNQVCNLNGLINLQILVVSSCAIMSQAMGTIPVSNELKCILTLCKSAECRCGLLIKKKFGNVFSTQVIIIPSGRYNGRLATTSESYRKAMFLRRKGIVFARGSSSFEKFATCNLPNDVQEEFEEVKKSRSSIVEKVDF